MTDNDEPIEKIDSQEKIIELARVTESNEEFVNAVSDLIGPLKDNSSAWLFLTTKLLEVGLPPAALATCKQGLRINPNEALGWTLCGELLRLGLKQIAMSFLTGTDEKKLAKLYLGRALLPDEGIPEVLQKMKDDAAGAYRKATELDPTNAVYWLAFGRQLSMNRSDEAEIAYRKAIDIEPHDSLHWVALYDWYITNKRESDAKTLAKQAKDYKFDLKKELKKIKKK